MGDNTATIAGYTQEIVASSPQGFDLYLLVKPGTDFEDTFRAWDTDNQEWVRVNGWLFQVETV